MKLIPPHCAHWGEQEAAAEVVAAGAGVDVLDAPGEQDQNGGIEVTAAGGVHEAGGDHQVHAGILGIQGLGTQALPAGHCHETWGAQPTLMPNHSQPAG